MTNVVKTWEVQDQCTPVIILQFSGDMSRHIIVDLGEVLAISSVI